MQDNNAEKTLSFLIVQIVYHLISSRETKTFKLDIITTILLIQVSLQILFMRSKIHRLGVLHRCRELPSVIKLLLQEDKCEGKLSDLHYN